MKQTIGRYDFIDAFRRAERFDQFGGYAGLALLFGYLENLEEDTGEELELDVIALCCDFSLDTEEDIRTNYDIPESEPVLDYLNERTNVVGRIPDGIIYQQF